MTYFDQEQKAEFNSFYQRWSDKCTLYKPNRLADQFDLFFSRWIIYNALYNTLNIALPNKKEGDRSKAVYLIANRLSKSHLDIILDNPLIERAVNTITQSIEEDNGFGISFDKYNTYQPSWDKNILRGLQLTGRNKKTRKKKLIHLLTATYNIRCNTFHGRKGFHEAQMDILKAVNAVLEVLVPIVKEHLEVRWEEQHNELLQDAMP